jgi:hypothetical protein
MEEGKVGDGVVFQELCSSFINKLHRSGSGTQVRLNFGASKL